MIDLYLLALYIFRGAVTEDRIAKMNRQVERSLRNIVKENRKQMRTVITDEEKSLQILAEGQ
jgi:hypothetical protein|tara:strand:- start:2 stop:187 length:186 start_codon:yes stop_codon:yes gene_type:complete